MQKIIKKDEQYFTIRPQLFFHKKQEFVGERSAQTLIDIVFILDFTGN